MNNAVYHRKEFLQLADLPPRLKSWAEDYELENYIKDEAFYQRPLAKNAPLLKSSKRVAVIGSGPAGLGCADELVKLGAKVQIFERADKAGGLLIYGVPNLKLPKDLLAEKIAQLKAKGVKFTFDYELNSPEQFAALQKDFDAVVLCVGSRRPRQLPGITADNKTIYNAADFLTLMTKDMFAGGSEADLQGKDVVIIGGGDTGTDCAAIAFAQGASSIHQLEQQECGSSSSREDLCQLAVGDVTISYATRVKNVLRDESGSVSGVETVRVEWRSSAPGSLPQPHEIAGSEKTLPCQVLILALGFTGPEQQMFDATGAAKAPLGTIAGDAYFTTSLPGVFAAGDARRGSGVVAWAFAEGRNAATECAKWLNSQPEN